jgi:hypothetical protein
LQFLKVKHVPGNCWKFAVKSLRLSYLGLGSLLQRVAYAIKVKACNALLLKVHLLLLYGLNLHLLLYGSKIIKLHLAFQCLRTAPPIVFTNINITCCGQSVAILSVEYV